MNKKSRLSPSFLGMTPSAFLIVTLLLAAVILFVLSYWNSFSMPFERDEGEYAFAAWVLDEGGVPYVDTFLQKPPLIVYVYWLAHKIGPFTLWAPRLMLALFNVFTLLFLFLFVKKQAGAIPGMATVLMAIPLLSARAFTGVAANTEPFMLMPLTGLLVLSFYKTGSAKAWVWLLAGACAAFALLFKPIAALPAAAILVYWCLRQYKQQHSIRLLTRNTLLCVCGGAGTTAAVLLPILLRGGIDEFWFQTVVYNARYIRSFNTTFPSSFYFFLGVFWDLWWPLVVLALASVILRPRHWIFLWVAVLLSLLTVMRSSLGHYYLMVAPFFVCIASLTLARLWHLMGARIPQQRVARVLQGGTLLFVMAVILSFPIDTQYRLSGPDLSLYLYGKHHPFIESSLMASQVRSHTREDDLIFIAGSEPQIYYFSRRRSASKYDITFPLFLDTPYREQCQRDVIQELSRNKPAAIIVAQTSTSGVWDKGVPTMFVDFLRHFTAQHYRLVGGTLASGFETRWVEPLETWEEKTRASLLLLVRSE
ncbi:MAG: glycosyltransferase family 39 protein [Chitinispirillaceae bacterium]|nr:glycosyltransferase family 39 protein [Chitinispirillaceae bacterium]